MLLICKIIVNEINFKALFYSHLHSEYCIIRKKIEILMLYFPSK